jgi:hypothetical protein
MFCGTKFIEPAYSGGNVEIKARRRSLELIHEPSGKTVVETRKGDFRLFLTSAQDCSIVHIPRLRTAPYRPTARRSAITSEHADAPMKSAIPQTLTVSPASISCPFCDAEPGQDCETTKGGFAAVHIQRVQEAARTNYDRKRNREPKRK